MIKFLFKSLYFIVYLILWVISLIVSAFFGMLIPVFSIGLVILLLYIGAKRMLHSTLL